MPAYFLPFGVHVCLTSEGAVFLVLKKDQYIGIGRERVRALQDLLTQKPADAEAADFGRELVRHGLLTLDASAGLPYRGQLHSNPTKSLSSLRSAPKVTVLHMFRLATAYIAARVVLKFSVTRAVERVAKRNARFRSKTCDSIDKTQELVSVFRYLRPLFFASPSNCLCHALILSEFLGAHGLSATMVFGTKLAPFQAHCWLQKGEFVLIGRPEIVNTYTPILTV